MYEIKISTDTIKLDSFLKWCGAVSQGSEAKIFIKNGKVKVNGEIETRRGRKLYKSFIVEFGNKTYKIV
ncbi:MULTISPECIES: S4 domain-containing protein YaaA [Clostridium]|jgi:ribosome-associated protein|uniref:S4 domain-containing protein YaaA n=1 Tax=Clostridium lapidicellarium TaxID=3240931 RepID=A0ABV4DVL7_9CLOT|nr:S4 domain-containing protein YaaA [uncultured Clostridium sp.]